VLWLRVAAGALTIGRVHARRGDAIAALANLTQAVLATAQGRLAANGDWALNEKRIIKRAVLTDAGSPRRRRHRHHRRDLTSILGLPAWREQARS
jgi:hypothetical protein